MAKRIYNSKNYREINLGSYGAVYLHLIVDKKGDVAVTNGNAHIEFGEVVRAFDPSKSVTENIQKRFSNYKNTHDTKIRETQLAVSFPRHTSTGMAMKKIHCDQDIFAMCESKTIFPDDAGKLTNKKKSSGQDMYIIPIPPGTIDVRGYVTDQIDDLVERIQNIFTGSKRPIIHSALACLAIKQILVEVRNRLVRGDPILDIMLWIAWRTGKSLIAIETMIQCAKLFDLRVWETMAYVLSDNQSIVDEIQSYDELGSMFGVVKPTVSNGQVEKFWEYYNEGRIVLIDSSAHTKVEKNINKFYKLTRDKLPVHQRQCTHTGESDEGMHTEKKRRKVA